MMRWPAHLVDRQSISAFLTELDDVKLWRAGQNLILDIHIHEMDFDFDEDENGWLSDLAPLRADVVGGDLRMFYLLWLLAVQTDLIAASYDRALEMLSDLKVIADDAGEIEDFLARVEDIRRRYARRPSLLKRLVALA